MYAYISTYIYAHMYVWSHWLWRGIYGGNLQDPGGMLQRASQGALPIHAHSLHSGHQLNPDQFNILGREDQDLSRLIKESINISVNNPTMNRNIGKFNLSHIWDRVLFSTPDLCIYVYMYVWSH